MNNFDILKDNIFKDKNDNNIISMFIQDDLNKRIDKFLSDKLNLSRSYVKYLIENNLIKVNNKIVKSSYILKKGDNISLNLLPKNTIYSKNQYSKNEYLKNNNITIKLNENKNLNEDKNFINFIFKTIKVLYEDENVIIIDKIPIVVNKINKYNFSIIDYLLLKGIDPFIVHRLDKQTTGCLIVAKNYQTALKLSNLFKNREVIKKYYAIVLGNFKYNSIKIEGDIFHSNTPLKKEIISYGKNAITIVNKIKTIHYKDFINISKSFYEWEIKKVNKNIEYVSLLDINILTGRTHQIRVHLSNIGYPVLGDYKYGDNFKFLLKFSFNNSFYNLETFFLHAYYLRIDKYEAFSEPLWYHFFYK